MSVIIASVNFALSIGSQMFESRVIGVIGLVAMIEFLDLLIAIGLANVDGG
jgi:hypothetical protein